MTSISRPSLARVLAYRALQSLRRRLARLLKRRRDTIPWATHIPVLVSISRTIPIRHVLECGAGKYSTLLFLDRAAFPNLSSLMSLEDDSAWLDRVRTLAGTDPRLTLHFASGSVASAVRDLSTPAFDLVLVDDSKTPIERAATLAEFVGRPGDGLIVVHDFDRPEYQEIATAFRNAFIFDALNPPTAVAWHDDRKLKPIFRRLNRAIRTGASKLESDDVAGWTAFLLSVKL